MFENVEQDHQSELLAKLIETSGILTSGTVDFWQFKI